jgi:rare lipoprotein A
LAGCASEATYSAPPAAQMLASAPTPVAVSTRDIVVPMPLSIPGLLARSASTPQAERRNAVVKVGKPYQVAGNWYYPSGGQGYDEEGIASWYGSDFDGKSTANGEIYNMDRLSAAHPTLPMPCYVSVTNEENGRTLIVRVNDRGPYKAGRIIDLSQRAARLLGVTRSGTAAVRVKYLRMAPLMSDDRYVEQFAARQPWYRGPDVAELTPKVAPGWQVGSAVTLPASAGRKALNKALADWSSSIASAQ